MAGRDGYLNPAESSDLRAFWENWLKKACRPGVDTLVFIYAVCRHDVRICTGGTKCGVRTRIFVVTARNVNEIDCAPTRKSQYMT